MRKSWTCFFRRIAGVCFVFGATAWTSALCYAQIAADSATDAVYADGWQAGDNGGNGFGPWDFTGTYDSPVQQAINSTSPFNQLGTAWTLYNPAAPEPGMDPGEGTDIGQAGRRILGDLQPGHRISVTVDNPTERRFFRGYTVRLNTGAGNTIYNGTPKSRLAIGTFEYAPTTPSGRWFESGSGAEPTLFDNDTDAGMRIDVLLTSPDTYELTMAPLDNPANTYSTSGVLDFSGPIDWIEFELYNTDSDFYPELQLLPNATDFYISAISIVDVGLSRWNVDADGNWSDPFNWAIEIPDATGAKATFGSIITAPRTVTVDGVKRVGKITFDNANSYTLAGAGPLRIDNGGAASIDVARGNHTISAPLSIVANNTVTKSGPGTLTISGTQNNGAATAWTVAAGTLNLNSDAGSNTTVNANSTTSFGSTQHLAALNIGAGATTTITPGGAKNVVTGALTMAGGSAPTGKLDVTDNAVIVNYPTAGPNPEATIRAQIISGRGGSGLGKTWNGPGITSSTAAAGPVNATSVGYAVNGQLPLGAYLAFRGEPVDASTVLVRYTRTGDANLDGVVNNDDVTIVGAQYAPGSAKPRWDLGDFDYNGFVDNDDVTLLGVYYNPSAPAIPAPSMAAVPEPWALALVVCGTFAAVLIGARRKM